MSGNAQMISRRWLLGALLAGVAVPAAAEAPLTSLFPMPRGATLRAPVPKPAAALIEAAKLGGAVGFVVADAATGEVLESIGARLARPPASTLKAITALYALERLGAGHRFATRLLATGPLVGGRIEGDLVLVGSGDPTLSTDVLGDMAEALAALGVREVAGRYLAFGGALPAVSRIDPGQPDHVGYNPGISGLNLNYNRVHFEWKRAGGGYDVAMDARAERFVPRVSMSRMQVVNRSVPLFTYQQGDSADNWTVAQAALGQGGSRWMPVRHPDVYAAEVFQTLALAQGVKLPVAGFVRVLPEGRVLVERQSADLTPMLRDLLRFSTNLTAEVVGLTASGARTLEGSAGQMAAWAAERYGLRARFVDHSGLGAGSRIAQADMVAALVAGRNGAAGPQLHGVLRDFGMRDAQGRVIEGHPVRVLAKTGTLNFVSGLAGYMVPKAGRELAFAVFASDLARRGRLDLAEREQPPGGEDWTRRARQLQARLLDRWAGLYIA
ncbi:D-alanyl-D-alanine carboxypeptidase/D-alanyl-D-alanine-endopeptidase [Paracoccaceae bacterium Fryx2]|nr:D-alanyl-D-alanine carboxypeptidase/D-alanyl-D-alanine-endopeptidase [Paracoccaceae bacterium Fryx2]